MRSGILRHTTATIAITAIAAVLAACSPESAETAKEKLPRKEVASPEEQTTSPKVAPTRSAAELARDQYRHPAETLMFFEVDPGHTVVELWPGGGWYTAILAPYLKNNGQLIAAHFPADSEVGFFQKSRAAFNKRCIPQWLIPDNYFAVLVTQQYL